MSDNKTSAAIVKVKYFRKKDKQLEKIEFDHSEQLKIRKWFLTGTFSNTFFLKDDFDKSMIGLLKKIIMYKPEIILNIISETFDKSLNKKTFIYTLVLLSNDSFRAKKIFKMFFNKIIKDTKDLYFFMECCKKERGFGQVIHEAIKYWLKCIPVNKLEQMFIENRSGYNWKSQDVIRLIRPKATTKIEDMLYKWIAKDTLLEETDDLREEYRTHLPLVYLYELMRRNEKIDPEMIKMFHFKNSMIPSNFERTNEVIGSWLTNFEEQDYPLTSISRYSNKLNNQDKLLIQSFIGNNRNFKKFSLLALLSTCSSLLDQTEQVIDVELFNSMQNALEDRIKKTYNNNINILDTNISMLDGKIKETNTSPAITASVIIGCSKNVIDFNGNLIGKRSARGIIEAEGFIESEYIEPNYKKIFYEINKMESDIIVVWSNKELDKKRFYREFTSWKNENNKIMKLVFVNLYEPKVIKLNIFKEIYGINNNTEKLLELIKKGEI